MATWSLVETINLVNNRGVASNGSNTIYITSGIGDNIFQYNHVTDTTTQISNSTSFVPNGIFSDSQNGTNSIVYFGNKLYAAQVDGSNNFIKVYRYGGSGVLSWSEVLSYTVDASTFTMLTDDTEIVLVDETGIVHYTFDGDNWNNTTVSSFNTYVSSWPGGSRNNNLLGNIFTVRNSNEGWFYLLEYTGSGTFNEVDVLISEIASYRTSGKINHWLDVSGEWRYSPVLIDTYTASTTQPTEIPFTITPFYDYAIIDSGGSVRLHLWTGSDFDSGELIANGTWNLPGGGSTIVTFPDGEILILRQNGSNVEIWKRSEPLPAPVTTDELRYINFMADDTNLYITANENQVLQLYAIDLQTLALSVLQSFGASTYAELDSKTYGILPKTIPNLSGILWLYGNDGDDNQLMLSVDYGANFDIISSPLTTDFVSGLHINMFQPDDIVITVFKNTDNILYVNSSEFDWIAVDNYAANILASERSPIVTTALIVASDAGNLSITPNLGNDFVDITSTLPQVNVIRKAY